MANERKTENLVRKYLAEQGYFNDDNIKIEEQISENPKINHLLQKASKSGQGKGYPEFIISFSNNVDKIIVIECKADINKHESLDKTRYKEFAVDGVLKYASHLSEQFNVIAIAASGENEREFKLSHFFWGKQKHSFVSINDKHLLSPSAIFSIIEKQNKPLDESELIREAIKKNKELHDYSIPEVERCTVISAILIALQHSPFAESYKQYHDNFDKYSNDELIDSLIDACRSVLRKKNISIEKNEVILREYNKIKQSHIFRSEFVRVKNKQVRNTVLLDLIDSINTNILPYIHKEEFDVLGKFYTQFIRYAGSDSKTGLVLTPSHITDLFCELSNISENDVIFDPCCGTGSFLVSSMKYMLDLAGNDPSKHKNIKSQQLIGIERRADMFSHACSNMMMRGDGKSHIHFGDCFDPELKKLVKKESPTKVFLNPPYDIKDNGQLEFIENAMEVLPVNGTCVAICQMSAAISTKKSTIHIKERLLSKHTLEAVMSMPDDLFYPVGVVTCIMIFTSGIPHYKKNSNIPNKKTWFGYWKNDGFIKTKNKGRIDEHDRWKKISSKWIDAYRNRDEILGESVASNVTHSDEWCAEAYMETDYSKLSKNEFEDVVKDFFIYQIKNELAKYDE